VTIVVVVVVVIVLAGIDPETLKYPVTLVVSSKLSTQPEAHSVQGT